jgi:tRNA pseudouridine55 synthase
VRRARGDTGLDAFINVCKPPGPTSHDIVADIRRVLGTRRVGHSGTLDPLAEGVLPVAVGRATRLIDALAAADKEYYAEAVLGVRTSTDDAAGEVTSRQELPDLSLKQLDDILAAFVGTIDQIPPAYSAVKVAGRRSHELARTGRGVKLTARRVAIYSLERLDWERPLLRFKVRCSKGTYIRALARDLGDRLGIGASLCRLVRLRVGPFTLGSAIGTHELAGTGTRHLLPPDTLVLDTPALVMSEAEAGYLREGRSWSRAEGSPPAELARAYALGGVLHGLVRATSGRWQPRRVFAD